MNPYTKKKKVAIVGFAPSWTLAPFDDEEFEIWVLNEFYKLVETKPEIKDKVKVDRWFEIHSLERPPKNSPEHISFLQKLEIPLYTLKQYDFMPNATVFPFDGICDWLKDRGHIGWRYFTNSISWMLGLALMEGFEEIQVFGVDMAQDRDVNGNSEYGYQKPSCEYFLGVAEKYAKVFIPDTSDLLMCAQRYAVDSDNERYVYLKKQIDVWSKLNKDANGKLAMLQQQMKQIEAEIISRNGAVEGYRTLLKKRM